MKLASVVVPSVVATALVLTLGACGSKSSSSSGDANADSNSNATTETKKADPASAKVAVTIDGMRQTTDYGGKPCIVVDFTFTNVSEDDPTSFMVATNVDVFQNGVELDSAIVSDIDSSASMNKVKAGSSIAVQKAYVLNDSSDVEVNVYPLVSFDKKPLAQQTFSLS